MGGEIGRVVLRFCGRVAEAVLRADGRWAAPDRLREFLDAACPPGRFLPADGVWGYDQLRRAAALLGGTAVPRVAAGGDPGVYDAQPGHGAAAFAGEPIPPGAVRVDVPVLHQDDDSSCGVVILESFARHLDAVPDGVKDFRGWLRRRLGTTRAAGTPPASMVRVARLLKLAPAVRHPMTADELRTVLDDGRPVVCVVQAWGDPAAYPGNGAGHYVGAIGYDASHVYFEDPMIRRARGYMGWGQFLERWHDEDAAGNQYVRWGMALGRRPVAREIR